MSNTARGLVEFVKKARDEKWYYVYGTYGQVITPEIIDRVTNRWSIYSAEYKARTIEGRLDLGEDTVYGDRGADCIGLIKAYLWWRGDTFNPTYVSSQDTNANGMLIRATEKGILDADHKIPEIVGLLVHMDGHVGVYIGNGKVIEARGAIYGVVETNLADRPWKNWEKCIYIDYSDAIDYPYAMPTRTLSFGSTGNDVLFVKDLLIKYNYNVGAHDIIFDKVMDSAVRQFQADNNLEVDGKIGANTRKALLNPIIKVTEPVPVVKVNPYPRPSFTSNIRMGAKSPEVKWIQWQLLSLGYFDEASDVDGSFGADTDKVVRKFQTDRKLEVDGVVGVNTNKQLVLPNPVIEVVPVWKSPYARPPYIPNLRITDSGTGVKWIQSILAHNGYMSSTKVTGYFGTITKEAVIAFQKKNALKVDGVVGTATNNKLQEYNK